MTFRSSWPAVFLFPARLCLITAFTWPGPALAGSARITEITLSQAVTEAVAGNFDGTLEWINSAAAGTELVSALSEFDPQFGAEAAAGKSATPSSSVFADPAVVEKDVQSGEISISGKAQPGTQYKLAATTSRETTNSSFQSLNPSYGAGLKLELTQPVLKNAGISVNRWRITSAEAKRDMAFYKLKTALSDIVTRTQEAYWDLVYQKENVQAQKEALDRARDLERRVTAQVKAGALAPIEIIAAQASVASWEEKLIAAENSYCGASDNLIKLMGSRGKDPAWWDTTLEPGGAPEPESPPEESLEALEQALSLRPDILAAQMEVENRRAELLYRNNQTLPGLDMVGTVNLSGLRGEARPVTSLTGEGELLSPLNGGFSDSVSDVVSGNYYDYMVGLKFSLPLDSRGASSAAALAGLNLKAAQTRLEMARRDAALEVREAARNLASGLKQTVAARAARELAEKRLDGETKKLEAGATTPFAVLEYQKELVAQRAAELLAQGSARKAAARYWKAVGLALAKAGVELSLEAP
ncbi:MAG: TolC family protein [Nitrospinae bacterium]|nr:TolC family protein [Nitrospinota bacterium]